jgi:hypothetical protein
VQPSRSQQRNVVVPHNSLAGHKPPTLETHFPSAALPTAYTNHSLAQTLAANNVRSSRPHSAKVELSLYHAPQRRSDLQEYGGGKGVEEGKKRDPDRTGHGGKRPQSAQQMLVSQRPQPPVIVAVNQNGVTVPQPSVPFNPLNPHTLLNSSNLLSGMLKDKDRERFLREKGPTNNKDLIQQSKTQIEQIYAPIPVPGTSANASKRSKSASHTRPSSAHHNSSQGGNTNINVNNNQYNPAPSLSAVDRAMSIGRTSTLIERERLQRDGEKQLRSRRDNDQQRLHEMLEGDIIEKLDTRMLGNRR